MTIKFKIFMLVVLLWPAGLILSMSTQPVMQNITDVMKGVEGGKPLPLVAGTSFVAQAVITPLPRYIPSVTKFEQLLSSPLLTQEDIRLLLSDAIIRARGASRAVNTIKENSNATESDKQAYRDAAQAYATILRLLFFNRTASPFYKDTVKKIADGNNSFINRVFAGYDLPEKDITTFAAAVFWILLENQARFRDALNTNPELAKIAGAGGNTLLHWAAARGQLDMVDYLLAHGADPQAKHSDDETALSLAQRNGYQQVAYVLKVATTGKPKRDPEDSRASNKKVIRDLLLSGAKVPLKGLRERAGRMFASPALDAAKAKSFDELIYAILEGNRARVNQYLQEQSDLINIADPEGNTPLHWAAALGNAELVRLLLRGGANPAAQNHGGYTALGLALQNGHEDAAQAINESAPQLQPAPLLPQPVIVPSQAQQQQAAKSQGWLGWTLGTLGFGGSR
jgi:ankyrin repeat protein